MSLLRVGLAIGAGAIAVLPLAGPAEAQTTGERIDVFNVAMQLERDGRLLVREEIRYDFGATAHHGIFRDLVERETYDSHNDRLYRVNGVTATADGNPTPLQVSHSGRYLHVRIGDANTTVTGIHTYAIAYRVDGATRTFADHQELYWDAIGNQWPVPIVRATVDVTVAPPARISQVGCYAGAQGSRLGCTRATNEETTARFTQTNLGPDEGLTIVVGLPRGSIALDPQPILERRRTLADAFAVRTNTLVPAIVVALLTVALVLRLARRRGRDRRYSGSAVDAAFGNRTGAEEPVGLLRPDAGPVEFVPPDGVLPGQVGTLADEHANLVDVTATIVDLAVRGWLTITDLDGDYQLTATQVAGKGTPVPYETALMNALFGGGPSVKLSDLKYKFRAQLSEIQSAMYDDVVTQGWYLIRPDRTRQRWLLLAVGGVVASIAATVIVAVASSFGLVPLGLLLGAITLLAVAGHMPARTGKGSAMFSRVRGFRRLFDEGDQGLRERFAEDHDVFSKYLPYAIVFGCTDKWARVFEQLDAQQLETGWYRGNAPFNAILLASSINNFGTVATGTLYASQPSSSSSSGFGGGFSGGGGGGGGGGSW
ncbi:MAG TPA: DUF2207 domain-containing protein [Acidimicrobiia bacterium]|nr:DUF2207 domain-containing protein [Acidimicrobiia bacterium]